MVHWCNHHVKELVPGYWVLLPCEVGFTKEDEDRLDACCSGALKACDIVNVKVYAVIKIHQVMCGNWVSIGIEDTCVHVVFDGLCEMGCRLSLKGMTLLYLVKNGLVFQ